MGLHTFIGQYQAKKCKHIKTIKYPYFYYCSYETKKIRD